jgi:hypothetical protein
LGCSAVGFPALNSFVTMRRVHANMGITADSFQYFVTQLGLTLHSFGVDALDISTIVVPLLNQFGLCGGDNQVCEDAKCPLATQTFDQECVFQSEKRRGTDSRTAEVETYVWVTGVLVVAVLLISIWISQFAWKQYHYSKI